MPSRKLLALGHCSHSFLILTNTVPCKFDWVSLQNISYFFISPFREGTQVVQFYSLFSAFLWLPIWCDAFSCSEIMPNRSPLFFCFTTVSQDKAISMLISSEKLSKFSKFNFFIRLYNNMLWNRLWRRCSETTKFEIKLTQWLSRLSLKDRFACWNQSFTTKILIATTTDLVTYHRISDCQNRRHHLDT
jgi:hypothetical protein